MTRLLLNRAHYPVTTLGPGIRAGIWTQGCTIACPGCLARDTWPVDQRRAVPIDVLLGWLASLPAPDGVTISGGEPFQQPAALGQLLDGIHSWREGLPRPLDILAYSGYPMSWLRRHRQALLDRCDAVVAGPYVERRNTSLRWRGSSNQRLVPLSELGQARYGPTSEPVTAPALQVGVDGGTIWSIGIPGPGDLDRLAGRLRSIGMSQEVSWRL